MTARAKKYKMATNELVDSDIEKKLLHKAQGELDFPQLVELSLLPQHG